MTTAESNPGTPRREGRGFVTSFGQQRTCAAAGCTTTLSRYNDSTCCWTHDPGRRRS